MEGHNGFSGNQFCEQTVEIARGPKPAFGTAGIGALTRRVALWRVVTAAPAKPSPPRPPREPRMPRMVEHVRTALNWEARLDSEEAPNHAAIARREGIARARVTQILGLLCPPHQIRAGILALADTTRRPAVMERALRPIVGLEDLATQKGKFQEFLGSAT